MDAKIIFKNLVVSFVFFVILFVVVYLLYLFPKDNPFKIEPIHVFIALVPFVILLIMSGKLQEIKGPGGITLTLKNEAYKPISPEYEERPLEFEPEITVEKGGLDSLRNKVRKNPPTTLSFKTTRVV